MDRETIYFDSVVLWTRLCAMPVCPQGGIGNCTVKQLHSFAEEFFNAQFVVQNGTAELAGTGNVPTRLSQIKSTSIYCFVFTVQIYFVLQLRVHRYFHHQTYPLWTSSIINAEYIIVFNMINWRKGNAVVFLLVWCNLEWALEKGMQSLWLKTLLELECFC